MRPINLIVSLFQNSQLTRNLKLINCRPIKKIQGHIYDVRKDVDHDDRASP